MDEREELGKIAYEAFLLAKRGQLPPPGDIEAWDEQLDQWRQCWIAVGQAVAERVISDLQTSVEASE